MRMLTTLLVPFVAMSVCGAPHDGQDSGGGAAELLASLEQKIPGFSVMPLPIGPGEMVVPAEAALTVDELRGVQLDDSPPALGTPKVPHDPRQTDDFPPGQAPYEARGILPFRLHEFTCEFNYGGWHNFKMIEYASCHGFGVIYPYVMPDLSHLPAGTKFLQWGSFVDWHQFFSEHNIPWGRFDLLADLDVVELLLRSGKVWEPRGPEWIAMLDLEHEGPLAPEKLREQEWYPRGASAEEKRAFEDKYYRGYLLTNVAPIEALRRKGFKSIGVYPQGYGSRWYALLGLYEKGLPGVPDPATHWPWLRWGRAFVEAQDVLYPDVYVYYWSPQNVAYTLARLDFDRALVNSLPRPKPIRPYYWPLLHGGSAQYHWWNQQPLPNEDMRAIFALAFFCGVDGVVLWNWSGTGNHHVPPPLWRATQSTPAGQIPVEGGTGGDVMLREDIQLRPEGTPQDAPPATLRRYDVLAITSVDEATGLVRFQRIDTVREPFGPRVDPARPTFVMHRDELLPHLRPLSEPVAGAIEGLALVKAFEPILRHGEIKVDVPALKQFAETLPVVRRVKLGNIHLIATYDPMAIRGGEKRNIVLRDFDGHRGVTLILPADADLRIFALREM
ncbi:MAG: hypothetical protein H5T86_00995 [Armatimonadetes bacterium]|nr:hypothetical protein [Armatimonadota bacterium]